MTAVLPSWSGKSAPALEEKELLYFCALIEERAGIHLKPGKQDLVRTRLQSRIAACGLKDFSEYRKFLSTLPAEAPEWEIFTNLLTTNKTDFFREPKHFEFLIQKILPEWLALGQKTFKVWSAACASGEEPYTLAMILARHLPPGRDFKILATDIDTDVLRKAQNGVYPLAKKSEIPPDFHGPSVDIGRREAEGWFRIKPALKEKITFKQHNLIERTLPGENIFDLVLCRNVLIYFTPETIQLVQAKLYQSVKSGGYFFIGHSESLQGLKHQWTMTNPSIFRKGNGKP